jgi:hypothetical protein
MLVIQTAGSPSYAEAVKNALNLHFGCQLFKEAVSTARRDHYIRSKKLATPPKSIMMHIAYVPDNHIAFAVDDRSSVWQADEHFGCFVCNAFLTSRN